MNTPNINNNNVGDLAGKARGLTSRSRTDRLQSSDSTETVTGAGEATEANTPVVSAQDSYQSTRDHDYARELTARIENNEMPVREDLVQQVRQKVATGYYDSQEFLGSLASKLINTDQAM